jgi:uridine kinase
MQPQDVVKLCFQAAFGAEHLLGDIGRVRKYFNNEFEAIPPREGLLAEFIAEDVCLVNMAVWKKHKLPAEWLFNLFVISAGQQRENGEEIFRQYIVQAEELPFASGEWHSYITEYTNGGIRPIHHSNAYRESEQPAYRVISGLYTRLIPILQHMTKACVIAIDGRAASGKTSIAADLAQAVGAGIIHVDDFFLPKELRTAERFSTPGGNFHHERLTEEVLPLLRSGEAFSYRKFDCRKMDFDGERQVAASPLRIVEGAYSHHPVLGSYMDLRVFSDISPEEQLARIEKRNGADAAKVFAEKWIPMEEEYLKAYSIKDNAHLVV